MATLPTTGDDLDLITFAVETQPSYTHKLDIDRNRVRGMTDERDAVLQAVYLILEQQQISLSKTRQRFPNLFRRNGLICSTIEQNAVLPVTVSLDNGMAGLSLHVGYQAHIHSRVLHHLQQKLPVVFSHSSGVPYLSSALCQGDGLV